MRDFSKVRKIVIKVGTNLISTEEGIDRNRIDALVSQIAALKAEGYQVLVVSSGAIGLGAKALHHYSPVVYTPMRQACASIGQPILMKNWIDSFEKEHLLCSQVLISRSSLNDRTGYVNLRRAVSELLSLGVTPVFNENDTVSTAEVFGDNDRMSSMVASKIDADLLILLTDIDGVYTANPKEDPEARLIEEIDAITEEIFSGAKGAGSRFATGGMKTKLLAAEIAKKGGCGTIIASGYGEDVLLRILKGEPIGTYIHPEERLSQRSRWILNSNSRGAIYVDEGAERALRMKKSLLPTGIKKVEGTFEEGEVIEVRNANGRAFAKASPYFNSTELELIQGHKSYRIARILGYDKKKEVVFRPEDLVFTEV